MNSEKPPIYTVGYGGRSVDELVCVLQDYHIDFVIDVRSAPYSKFNPDYSKDALEQRLKPAGFRYVYMGDLLGGRPRDESCYTNGYVDYEKLREKQFYLDGIARLRKAWEQQLRVAVLCSEGKPQACHRSKLIGVTLEEQGIGVMHIDERGYQKSQQTVMDLLTDGQLPLFGLPPAASKSRKKISTYVSRGVR
jgi:uncharacterized protein (DUF488 family)